MTPRLKRNGRPIHGVGLSIFGADDFDLEYRVRTHKRYESKQNEETIAKCEAAWAILVKYNKNGIVKEKLMNKLKENGFTVNNDFDMIMERHGYMLWSGENGNLHPCRHPNGEFIEYESPSQQPLPTIDEVKG